MADDSVAAFGKTKFTTSYPAGAVLFVEGQVPRGVYMLCQGQVKLTTASPEGKTIMRVAEAGSVRFTFCYFRRPSRTHGGNASTLPGGLRAAGRLSTPVARTAGYRGQRHAAIRRLLSPGFPADSLSWSDHFGHRKAGELSAPVGCAGARDAPGR